ncbi:hypothetical protein AQPE_2866 [Aquipluma nitroreducens]|uniref:Uncharacterized protein n=2 Tax=Aquipluma nitroreducens TaxID=2010828 RepID=A0A5K7SAW4_9BACT|nr:hypothetical protein AQPE_2866 [Aquipluma nitroreducens]
MSCNEDFTSCNEYFAFTNDVYTFSNGYLTFSGDLMPKKQNDHAKIHRDCGNPSKKEQIASSYLLAMTGNGIN